MDDDRVYLNIVFLAFHRDKSNTPSGFTLKLRKHIRTRRLEDVRQLGYDRVWFGFFYRIPVIVNSAQLEILLKLQIFFVYRLYSSNLDWELMRTMLFWSFMPKAILFLLILSSLS